VAIRDRGRQFISEYIPVGLSRQAKLCYYSVFLDIHFLAEKISGPFGFVCRPLSSNAREIDQQKHGEKKNPKKLIEDEKDPQNDSGEEVER
jgi:hypothetical protein